MITRRQKARAQAPTSWPLHNSESSTLVENDNPFSELDSGSLDACPEDSSLDSRPTSKPSCLNPDATPFVESPADSGMDDQVRKIKTLADKAKQAEIDPTLFLLSQLINSSSNQSQTNYIPYDKSKSLTSIIGKMSEDEDIFVFLHRFEFELTCRAIPQVEWLKLLPQVLTGHYREAYYNNADVCATFEGMRVVLLNAGGYSTAECLNSFPLKFRPGGSTSLIQWFNHWKNKFTVILDSLPFLSELSDKSVNLMANSFATIGVLAGMSQEHRDVMINKPCTSNQSFIQECSQWCLPTSTFRSRTHDTPTKGNYHSLGSQHQKSPHGARSFSSYQSSKYNSAQAVSSNARPMSPVRRELSTVTCFKCNQLGHYANHCPLSSNSSQTPKPTETTNPDNSGQSTHQIPKSNRPVPVPRTNPRPIRQVELKHSLSEEVTLPVISTSLESSPIPLNSFDDEFITCGIINGIETPIIIDSGAKISLISDDFIELDYNPVRFTSISGISQVPKSVPVFELPVVLPTLDGVCQLAVDSRLPPKTVLLGSDFGKQNIIELINHLRSEPTPVLTVTRAMQANSDIAEHVTNSLHSAEGATPLSLDDIVECDPVDSNAVSDPVVPGIPPSSANSLVPRSLPTLKFDGITKDQFAELQRADETLVQLWDYARKGEKQFFIVNDLLMCMTSTLNSVSHALVVPQSLRQKVLIAAHEGLGHGGLNTTRSLVNKHFTWPNLAKDIKAHIQACEKCILHNKSGVLKVPMVEPEIVSERGEKLALDIVGPLPTSMQKFRYIFTCIEMASGFPFAIPMKSYTSEVTSKALLSIISLLGSPLIILTDQGTNFMSLTLSHLKKRFNIASIRTSPYHPQSNGRLERFHSTLKAMLAKSISANHEWPIVIDLVLHFARNIPNSRHGFTPHELLFLKPSPFILSTLKSLWSSSNQSSVNLPQFIEDLDNVLACQTHHVKAALVSKHAQNRLTQESTLAADLKVGDTVYKRNPGLNKCLDASWDGPFTILKLLPPVNCSIAAKGRNTKAKVVHLSQLKKVIPINRCIIVPEDISHDEFHIDEQLTQPVELSLQQKSQLQEVLGSFPSVFSESPGLTSVVSHSISVTSQTPLWSPSYTIPLAHQEAFRLEIENLFALGIIEPSHSKWSSPPMPVRKKDGGIRIVIDYRKLNSVTVKDPFTMPSIDDILSQLGDSAILSKLDLLKGFHQVPMEESSKELTAFTCLQGKFQYRVMPFGLTNAPSTFQQLMQSVLRGLESHSLPYIDDVIIFSISFADHLKHVSSVLSRLASAGLTVKKSKCLWCFKSFEFLGFQVGNGRLSIPQARVHHISTYVIPKTKSALRSFLGLIAFYSRFIPSLASHTSVMSCHLTKQSPDKIQCTDDFRTSFDFIINSISSFTSLVIPTTNDALCVFTDASYSGVGGSLCVYRHSNWLPCGFYSRQLLPREKNYAAVDLEALALLATVTHFRYFLSGRFFKAFTDHSALVSILDGQPPSARLCRWKLKLLEYHFELCHIKGSANQVADALSRQSWSTYQDPQSSSSNYQEAD